MDNPVRVEIRRERKPLVSVVWQYIVWYEVGGPDNPRASHSMYFDTLDEAVELVEALLRTA